MIEPLFSSAGEEQTPDPALGTTKTAAPKNPENSGSTPTPCSDEPALAHEGGGFGTRPWWLALLACGGAYWPLTFEPSAMTRRHPYYCGHPHCRGHPPSWGGNPECTRGGFGMTPWCDDLVCSWRRLLADRHSLPFPWTLSLHRRWCPSASHHPLTFLFLPALTIPLPSPFPSLGLFLRRPRCRGGGGGGVTGISLSKPPRPPQQTTGSPTKGCSTLGLCTDTQRRGAETCICSLVRPRTGPPQKATSIRHCFAFSLLAVRLFSSPRYIPQTEQRVMGSIGVPGRPARSPQACVAVQKIASNDHRRRRRHAPYAVVSFASPSGDPRPFVPLLRTLLMATVSHDFVSLHMKSPKFQPKRRGLSNNPVVSWQYRHPGRGVCSGCRRCTQRRLSSQTPFPNA